MHCAQVMLSRPRKVLNRFVPLVLAALVASCAKPRIPAPVEERNVSNRQVPAIPPAASVPPEPVKTPSGENSGKPGFYTVKPGDTMIRIGLETGQNWKDLVKWNNLDKPNLIEVGQVLRVAPPAADGGVSTRPIVPAKIETRPLDARAAGAAGVAASAPAASSPSAVALAPAGATVPGENDDVNWQWPATGRLLSSFEEGKAKGLTIGGKAGEPVLAAAEGRVVYAGSGLRGYGNLVILKHNNTYLTAYAHNQRLVVKEDQNVRRGQKIAEMGSTDADRVQLLFEIRKLGKPVDPALLLPPR